MYSIFAKVSDKLQAQILANDPHNLSQLFELTKVSVFATQYLAQDVVLQANHFLLQALHIFCQLHFPQSHKSFADEM